VPSEAEPSTSATDCARVVMADFPTVMWFIRRQMHKGKAKGLSLPQFRVLCRVEAQASMSEIAYFVGATLPTVSRMVSGLVDRGYVSRVELATDRRCCQLSLTARGRAVLEGARADAQRAVAAELSQLSAAECRQITESMSLLGRVFRAASSD